MKFSILHFRFPSDGILLVYFADGRVKSFVGRDNTDIYIESCVKYTNWEFKKVSISDHTNLYRY